MTLYTNLDLLRSHWACTSGYRKLCKHLVDVKGCKSKATPIPILTILESNGLEDAVWALRATTTSSTKFAQSLAVEFAEHAKTLAYGLPGEDLIQPVFDAMRGFIASGDSSGVVKAKRAFEEAYSLRNLPHIKEAVMDALVCGASGIYNGTGNIWAVVSLVQQHAYVPYSLIHDWAKAECQWQYDHFKSVLEALP